MKNKLIILRGCSGAGKTTLADWLQDIIDNDIGSKGCYAVAADDFHYDEEGNYNFKVENLAAAHKWCKGIVDDFMELGIGVIIVHNTSTTEKEIKPYIELAEQYNYDVISLIVENRHDSGNVHEVPEEVLQRQNNNLRSNLKLLP